MEALVAEGKAVRHGIEESVSLKRQRGGMRRVVVGRVKYRSTETVNEETGVATRSGHAEQRLFVS